VRQGGAKLNGKGKPKLTPKEAGRLVVTVLIVALRRSENCDVVGIPRLWAQTSHRPPPDQSDRCGYTAWPGGVPVRSGLLAPGCRKVGDI